MLDLLGLEGTFLQHLHHPFVGHWLLQRLLLLSDAVFRIDHR